MGSQALEAASIAVQIISALAMVSNLLAAFAFVATKPLRSRKYGFVLNLILANIAAPILAIVHQNRPGKVPLSLVRISILAAQLSIVCVAANRLLALSLPRARYDAQITHRRILAACLLIWVASSALYVPLTCIKAQSLWIIRPLLEFLVLLFTGILYNAVFRKIAKYGAPVELIPVAEVDEESGPRLRHTRQFMVTFTIILMAYFVCWIPFCVSNIMIYVSGKDYADQVYLARVYHKTGVAIHLLSSLVNPFIYWWRIAEFRAGLYRLVVVGHKQYTTEVLEMAIAETDVVNR